MPKRLTDEGLLGAAHLDAGRCADCDRDQAQFAEHA